MYGKPVETHGENIFKRITSAIVLVAYVLVISPISLFAQNFDGGHTGRSVLIEKEEKAEVLITALKGGTVTLGDASIEIPEGALKEDTLISITRLSKVEDTGESLYNAIPRSGGYRFLPAGTKFEKDVTITLPYSAELNSKPQSLEELYTYFFDTEKKCWTKLERLEVDKENLKVRSLSSHFTDMINATLTLPESAGPIDVNLNSIKNLEAAKPDGHLIKFNPPNAGPMGDASFSFELGIPSGRHGMQPQVSVSYSSGSGNGIMGRGFDVSWGSTITTDTRNGLPNYEEQYVNFSKDSSKNDTYMLDGIILDIESYTERANKIYDITYRPQKESSFSRIIRYGAGSDNDWWEVTDKSGTKRIYAQGSSSCVGKGKRTFTWNLTKVEDVHGNNVIYEYEKKDGYVYPAAIWYTGFNGAKGNYCVKFHYDDTRKDVRIDARSREIVSCKRLLTEITTHYCGTATTDGIKILLPDEKAIRSYTFRYTEGLLAGERMLEALTVSNNAGESYEYAFNYEDFAKDADGNTVYFDKPVKWENGSFLNESSGKSIGANVHASAGVGFGTDVLDARATGGVSGSTSSSTGYTRKTLIDIDGDGKCEGIAQFGNMLRIYRQNSSGSGFESDYATINLSEFSNNVKDFLMNKEKSSSSSFGWNVYGGVGSADGIASTGYTYSSVTQDGSNSVCTGFYDMDGDGLVDIVVDTGRYLHNDTKANGEISFSEIKINNYPGTYTRKLAEGDDKLKEYRKSYAQQRPFSAWVPLYEGMVSVGVSNLGNIKFKVKGVIGNDEVNLGEGLSVKQGELLYLIPDLGDSPTKSELEKVMDWENTIEYTQAKVFGRNFEMPIFFPENTLLPKDYPKELDGLYDAIKNDKGVIIRYELKTNNPEKTMTSSNCKKLLAEGLFVPGVLTEELFKEYREYVVGKIRTSNVADVIKKKLYREFAEAYTYSFYDRLYHLTGTLDNNFFNNYIKGFFSNDRLEEMMSCYSSGGEITADLSGGRATYRKTATVTYGKPEGISGGNFSSGSCYMKDGKKLLNIGKIDGKDIIIDVDSKKTVSPMENEWKITVKEFDSGRCVLDIGDGKYTVSYVFKGENVPTNNPDDDEETCLRYQYQGAVITVKYSPDKNYAVNKGNVTLLEPTDKGLIKTSFKLWFPDGRSTFNSKDDFDTENLSSNKKDLLAVYEDEDKTISIQSNDVSLYGGKYGWYYGIWTGSDSEHPLTEKYIDKAFRNPEGSDDYEKYNTEKKFDDAKIKECGEEKSNELKGKGNAVQPTYDFGGYLPEKKEKDGESRLEGTVSTYMVETVHDANGVLNSESTQEVSSPFISAGKIRCNRLGGASYFNIEGIPEVGSSTTSTALQKTLSSGMDVTSGPQVSTIISSTPTFTTNEGSSWMVQTMQDVNSDRIPDVLKIDGEKCHVYFGSVNSKGEINYPSDPSFTTSDFTRLTENRNSSSSTGFSFSPSGAIQTIYSASGKVRGISLTNGISGSSFEGENETTATLMDINADGITDYVHYDSEEKINSVYLGTGDDFKKGAFEYGFKRTSKGSVSGNSGSFSVGNSLPIAGGKSSSSQNISAGVSGDVGVSVSTSSSVQDFMLMDVNGDGLVDVVRMADSEGDQNNRVYDVFFNTGSKIDSTGTPFKLRIPKWLDGNTPLSFGKLNVNNQAINGNGISGDKDTVKLNDSETIDLSGFNKDIDSLDCSVTASVNASGNLAVNVNIPIKLPIELQFNITANVGGGVNGGSTTTSATVKMIDMDGDGLADHVLNVAGQAIWWKRNKMGKVGLLNRIDLPQGGSIQIDYSESYGTRDNPCFKYVMSKVTVNDGTDGTGRHCQNRLE